MKLKIFSAVVALSSMVLATTAEPISFQYKYKVIANSYNISDEMNAYSYKERLIETYESLCFGKEQRQYQKIIIENIGMFSFDPFCKSYYKDGEIILIIGNGLGRTTKGRLKKNECDEETLHEKLYIYELFH